MYKIETGLVFGGEANVSANGVLYTETLTEAKRIIARLYRAYLADDYAARRVTYHLSYKNVRYGQYTLVALFFGHHTAFISIKRIPK